MPLGSTDGIKYSYRDIRTVVAAYFGKAAELRASAFHQVEGTRYDD